MTTGTDHLLIVGMTLVLPAMLGFWYAVGVSLPVAFVLAALSLPPLTVIAVRGARRCKDRP